MAAKDTAHTAAAIIGATLAAHGKTKPKNIEKAVRAYRACLDELNKPRPMRKLAKKERAAIDRAFKARGTKVSEDI
jgi:hypothetical protein